jgi:hypothetical protein
MWPFKSKHITVDPETKPYQPVCSECACLIAPGREVVVPNKVDNTGYLLAIWTARKLLDGNKPSYTYCQICRPEYDRKDSTWVTPRYYKTVPATEVEVDVDGKSIKKQAAAKKRTTRSRS